MGSKTLKIDTVVIKMFTQIHILLMQHLHSIMYEFWLVEMDVDITLKQFFHYVSFQFVLLYLMPTTLLSICKLSEETCTDICTTSIPIITTLGVRYHRCDY